MVKQKTYKRKSQKSQTGSFNLKLRKRNKGRTNTNDGTIWNKTEKQNDNRETMQILLRNELEPNQ